MGAHLGSVFHKDNRHSERIIIKGNSVRTCTRLTEDLVVEFPFMGDGTSDSEILFYLVSKTKAFDPVELYGQYSSTTFYLRKEMDLHTKEYIKSTLGSIQYNDTKACFAEVLEHGKVDITGGQIRWFDFWHLCIFAWLIANYMLNISAELAELIRSINERGVQPVWAWILERDRMLRRAAAYQLGV